MATNRDRVWTAVLELASRHSFTLHDVREQIEGEPPTDRCIQQTLSSMEDLDILDGQGGESSKPRKYSLGQRSQEAIHDATLSGIEYAPFRDRFSPQDRIELLEAMQEGLESASGDALSDFEIGLLAGEGTVKDKDGQVAIIVDEW